MVVDAPGITIEPRGVFRFFDIESELSRMSPFDPLLSVAAGSLRVGQKQGRRPKFPAISEDRLEFPANQ